MPHRLLQFHIEPGIDEPIPPDHHDHNHHHDDLNSSSPTRSATATTSTLTTKAAATKKKTSSVCCRLAASDDPWHRDVIDPHDDQGRLLYLTLHRMLQQKKQDMSTRRAMNQMAITVLAPIIEDEDYNVCHHFTELVDTNDVGAKELPPKPTTPTTQPTPNGLVVVDSHPWILPSTTKSKTMVLKSILRRGHQQQRPSPSLLPTSEATSSASSSSSLMRTRLMDEIHRYHNSSTNSGTGGSIMHHRRLVGRHTKKKVVDVDEKRLPEQRNGYCRMNASHGMECSNPEDDPTIEEPKPPLEHIRRGMDPWEDLEDPHIVGHLPKAVGTTTTKTKSSGLVVRKKDELGGGAAAADGTDSDNVDDPNYTTHHEFVLLEPVIEDEAFRIYDEIDDDGTNDPTTVEPEPPHPHHMHRAHPRQLYHKENEEDRIRRQQLQLEQLQHHEDERTQQEERSPRGDRNRNGSPNSPPSPPTAAKSYERAMNKKSRRKKKKLRKHTYGWK